MRKSHRIIGLLGLACCLMLALVGVMIFEGMAAVALVLAAWVLISFPLGMVFGRFALQDDEVRPEYIRPDDITSLPRWRRPHVMASFAGRDAVEDDPRRM